MSALEVVTIDSHSALTARLADLPDDNRISIVHYSTAWTEEMTGTIRRASELETLLNNYAGVYLYIKGAGVGVARGSGGRGGAWAWAFSGIYPPLVLSPSSSAFYASLARTPRAPISRVVLLCASPVSPLHHPCLVRGQFRAPGWPTRWA